MRIRVSGTRRDRWRLASPSLRQLVLRRHAGHLALWSQPGWSEQLGPDQAGLDGRGSLALGSDHPSARRVPLSGFKQSESWCRTRVPAESGRRGTTGASTKTLRASDFAANDSFGSVGRNGAGPRCRRAPRRYRGWRPARPEPPTPRARPWVAWTTGRTKETRGLRFVAWRSARDVVRIEGDRVVASAPFHDHGTVDSGGVYAFERDQGGQTSGEK